MHIHTRPHHLRVAADTPCYIALQQLGLCWQCSFLQFSKGLKYCTEGKATSVLESSWEGLKTHGRILNCVLLFGLLFEKLLLFPTVLKLRTAVSVEITILAVDDGLVRL